MKGSCAQCPLEKGSSELVKSIVVVLASMRLCVNRQKRDDFIVVRFRRLTMTTTIVGDDTSVPEVSDPFTHIAAVGTLML